MAKAVPFQQVDVFTSEGYRGNPLAVVFEADHLTDGQMQRFAHWTNLSETAFLLAPAAPEADYRVRIFTPTLELPFAGHPTLGTCHAWLGNGGSPRGNPIVQECEAGLISIRQDSDRLAFAAPPPTRSGPVDETDLVAIAGVLGIARDEIINSQWIDNGPGWVGILLADADRLLSLEPTFSSYDIGAMALTPDAETAIEVRAFFPKDGAVVEDPVTGSLNASLAQWLLAEGVLEVPYVASQGTALGRAGRVHVSQDGDDLWVGGNTVTCVEGTVVI